MFNQDTLPEITEVETEEVSAAILPEHTDNDEVSLEEELVVELEDVSDENGDGDEENEEEA